MKRGQQHELKGEKIDAVVSYTENKYKNDLENLVRKRLEKITEDEREYLEYLVDWCCSRDEFIIEYFESFTDRMPKDKIEGLRFLFRTGLLMLGGYTTSLIPLNHREQNDGWKQSFLRVEQELKE